MLVASWSDPAWAIWDEYPQAPVCAAPTSVYVWAPSVDGSTTGALGSQRCSGVYLGRGLVVTAGHCFVAPVPVDNGEGLQAKVFFGEQMHSEANAVGGTGIEAECFVYPLAEFSESTKTTGKTLNWDHTSGPDLAWCRLGEMPPEVVEGLGPFFPEALGSIVFPMIPTGCERDILRDRIYRFSLPPVMAVFAGSGVSNPDDPDSTGTKRVVEMPLLGQYKWDYRYPPANVLLAQQPAPYGCVTAQTGVSYDAVGSGDSGGPLFVRAADGTLRVVGIAQSIASIPLNTGVSLSKSAALRCEEGKTVNFVYFTPLPSHLAWLEASSGVDVTPCFDLVPGEGWVYSPGCSARHGTGFPEGKTWSTGCYDTSTTAPITACGGGVPPGPGDVVLPAAGTTGSPLEYAAVAARSDRGGAGAGALFSQATSPPVLGTRGDDVLLGTARVEALQAGPGHDVAVAGPGIDALEGGSGDDLLLGGAGDDLIHGGRGHDVMLGGPGDDTFFVFDPCEQAGVEVILGGPGHDVLVTSVPAEELAERGLILVGVEEVRVAPQMADWSACGPAAAAPSPEPMASEVHHGA